MTMLTGTGRIPIIDLVLLEQTQSQRSGRLADVVVAAGRTMGVDVRIKTQCLKAVISNYWVPKKGTKGAYECGENTKPEFDRAIGAIKAGRYHGIVSTDMAALHHIAPDVAKHCKTLAKPAGSIFWHEDLPVLFANDPFEMYAPYLTDEKRAVATKVQLMHACRLLNQIMFGKYYNMDPFRFTVVSHPDELREAIEMSRNAPLLSYDIETSGTLITCIGFTVITSAMTSHTYVVPLATNSAADRGQYWRDEKVHLLIIDMLVELLELPVPVKVPHNGGYDNTHMLAQHLVPVNNIFDTQHAMHAMWPTMRKALNHVASLVNSDYVFWKDDAKETDEKGKVVHGMPADPGMLFKYWEYNGRDCHATAWAAVNILLAWADSDHDMLPPARAGYAHAPLNFVREFMLQMGPCLYMGTSGFKLDQERQHAIKSGFEQEAADGLARCKSLYGDDTFNPNSPDQVAKFFYDVWSIAPIKRKGRSTDEKILDNFAEMHPLLDVYVQAIKAAKKPKNNASKYGKPSLQHKGRFKFNIKAAGTVTMRFSGSESNFWSGTNPQNVPGKVRDMMRAEPDHYIVAADYSQSDGYFVAFESEDPVMISTMLDDLDTHIVHVEALLGFPYDEVLEGKNANAKWVIDPAEGVRQVIKKVVHGTNYGMRGATMLVNSGRKAIVSAARALLKGKYRDALCKTLGLDTSLDHNADNWTRKQLEDTCEFLQFLYYTRYTVVDSWRDASVDKAAMDGYKATSFGPYTVVTQASPKAQPRFFAAFFGQAGTAGNINNSMLRLYYLCDDMWQEGFFLCLQVHDENIAQIPKHKLWLVDRMVNVMSIPCTIKGRTFTVPVEADLASSWTKAGVTWKGQNPDKVSTYIDGEKQTFPDYHQAVAAHEASITEKRAFL